VDVTSGFVQLTGPIKPEILKRISEQRYPFQTSFGPRTTAASLAQFHISDTAGNSCIINNKTYTVIDIQICQPVHTGYTLPGVSEMPSAEMIVCCSGTGEIEGALMCVPIFNTGAIKNDSYVSQVIHQPNVTTIATLDTVFTNQPSFRYHTCFETIAADNTPSTHSVYVHVFPNGIHLSNSDYTLLTKGTLPRFQIPATIRNGEPTVQTYTFTHGVKSSTQNSTNGFVYTVPISTSDEAFIHKFDYFLKGPVPVKGTSTSSSTLKTPDQYKCIPFDQNKNLIEQSGTIYVTPGKTNTTLQQLIAPPSDSSSTDIGGLSIKEIETIIGASVVGIVVAIVVGGTAYHLGKR
jgi:hypothetical protein